MADAGAGVGLLRRRSSSAPETEKINPEQEAEFVARGEKVVGFIFLFCPEFRLPGGALLPTSSHNQAVVFRLLAFKLKRRHLYSA